MTNWTHDALAADLAGHLSSHDTMVWTDMQLGPSGSPRPDVYTLRKSYSRPHPLAYEVKISRSDMRRDTTSGKWQSYLKYAGGVTFAVPDGLATVADIPEGCGLIVRRDAVWRYVRRPTLCAVTLPMDACMKLLIDGVGRIWSPPLPQPRTADPWKLNERVRKKFGKAVEQAARDLLGAQMATQNADALRSAEYERIRQDVNKYREDQKKLARAEVAQFESAKRELCEWLGLNAECTGRLGVMRAIERLKAACNADARVCAAERDLDNARRTIENALRIVTPAKDIAA